MPDLLLELFSEEIPARMQTRAAEDLRRLVTDRLVEAGLTYASAAAFSTPRRLTLALPNCRRGRPRRWRSARARAWMRPKRRWMAFCARPASRASSWSGARTARARSGSPRSAVPAATRRRSWRRAVEAVVRDFPWPKSMRWGSGALRWVRPLQRIVCLLTDEHGAQVVPLDIDGIRAGDETEGHRFMARGPVRVPPSTTMPEAGGAPRRARPRGAGAAHPSRRDAARLRARAGAHRGQGLLAEVAGLVEWPSC